jgi:hypothetical protein
MKCSRIALLLVASAGMAAGATSACSSDDSATAGGAGSAGEAGSSGGKGGSAQTSAGSGGSATAGHGGSGGTNSNAGNGGVAQGGAAGSSSAGTAGSGGNGTAGSAGTANTAGEGGAAGGNGEAGNGGEGAGTPCGPSLTLPVVPDAIKVTASAVLVAAYAAEGTQTYTCQMTGTGDTATYAWSTASVPAATLYDAECAVAAMHYAGPHWQANDGSTILGTKVRGVNSSTANSIQQLLLSAVAEGTTTGILTPVTAVQRLNTVGGSAPSTGCDAGHVNATVAVPYTATYYFYSGADTIPPA